MPTPHAWDCRCGTRNAWAIIVCRRCGSLRVTGRAVAPAPPPRSAAPPYRPQPAPAPPAAPPTPPPRPTAPARQWNPANLLWLLFLLPVIGAGLPRWLGGRTSHYEVLVLTSYSDMGYTGAVGILEAGGSYRQRSVQGYGDHTYDLGTGEIGSVLFQKSGGGGGRLTIELWRDGGKVREESTGAAYGIVSLAE